MLNENNDKFKEHRVKLIAIAADSERHLSQMKEDHSLDVEMIPDRGAKLAKLYNVYKFGKGAGLDIKIKQAIPSKFLITSDKKIVWQYIGKNKDDRPPIDMIMEAISTHIS